MNFLQLQFSLHFGYSWPTCFHFRTSENFFLNLLQPVFLRSALLANMVAHDYEDPIDTIQDLLDNDLTLTMPDGNRIVPMFRDSPIPNMRECFTKCVVSKNGLYNG